MLTVEKRDGRIVIPEATMSGIGFTEKEMRAMSGRFYKKICAWRVDEQSFWDEISKRRMMPVVLSSDNNGIPVSWHIKSVTAGDERECDPILRDYVRSLILHRSGIPPPPGKGHT